jgi:polyisoprenoid-binding protein YceI
MSGMSIRRWSWKRWAVVGVVAAVVLFVGGPFVYIHFIQGKAPAPLALPSTSPTAGSGTAGPTTGAGDPAGSGTADGTWKDGGDSVVGYRIDETIFGQSNVAVGRTQSITGSLTIANSEVTTATFTVDMTTVRSDEARRDDQFDGRIMDVATYPTSTFDLTQPIDLGTIPADGSTRTYHATGKLTLHGVTKTVTFTVQARRSGQTFEVAGQIPVTFADYQIGNPSFGPVSTQDHGILEFRLDFTKE